MQALRQEWQNKWNRELVTKEKYEQTLKWLPVVIALMNRKQFYANRIVRWLKQTMFRPAEQLDDAALIQEVPGRYRFRFTLTPDMIDYNYYGLTAIDWIKEKEKWADNNPPTRVVADIRQLNLHFLFFQGIKYRLHLPIIVRLARALARV
jgi:hypothetical protein